MKTKAIFLTVICCLIGTLSFASVKDKIKGNKKITTQSVSITNYNTISIACGEVIYEQSNAEPYLEIITDENILPHVEIKVENQHLIIQPKYKDKEKKNTYNLSPSKLIIKTNSTDLKKINNAGPGDITINSDLRTKGLEINIAGSGDVEFSKSFIGKRIKINQAGSGDIKIKNIEANNLDYNVAGSGDITVTGRVHNATYGISGSGSVKALQCVSENVRALVSGSGDIKVAANNNLDIYIEGSGNVTYKGNPKVTQNIQGSGNVSQIK